MQRPTKQSVIQTPMSIQGAGTPYWAKLFLRGSGKCNVTRVQLVDGDKVLKDIDCSDRPIDQMRAIDYIRPALGQVMAMDKLKGEVWARTFNYPQWQAERAAAAKERRSKKGPKT